MKERIIQSKKTTPDSFSIPALRQPTPGFGSQFSAASSQAVPDNSLVHDISRIPLRRPQTKLTVNQPGDIYEQEADTVAQQVMGKLAQSGNSSSIQRQQMPQEEELQMKPLASSITPVVQRESAPEEEEEELQTKSLDISTLQRESVPEEEEEEELQTKSLETNTLQPESTPEEEEEELQTKSLDTSRLQRESAPEEEEEEELQTKSLDTSRLQRESVPEEEEEELQKSPMVQRQAKAGMAANPDLETSINQARGSGQSMADNIRQPMEQAFGADFSGVKVHTDSQSDELNQSIQARAFTTGQDVFFRQGEYNPGSRGGQELLAHELTHVVQQNGGAVQRSPLPPQQLPQQTTSESSLAKAKEKIPKQMKQTAMLPMEPTLQRKISYKKGRYRSREELKSALVTIFGTDAEKEIEKQITEAEKWKQSVYTNYLFDNITKYLQKKGYEPNYAVSTEDSTGKHGPKLPDRPDRDTLESRPDAAMSAFNISSVTLGRITIWHPEGEIIFHDRNVDRNVHAEDGLIAQVNQYIKENDINPLECKVNLTINNFFCGPKTTKKGKGNTNCLDLILQLQSTYNFPDFHVYFQNTYGELKYMDESVERLKTAGIKVSSFTTSNDKPPYTNKILDPESGSEEEKKDEKKKKKQKYNHTYTTKKILDSESESEEEEKDEKKKKKQKYNHTYTTKKILDSESESEEEE
ncbi:MAG: DUF4157 domain-containing protein, partial [Nostoc sp.]